MKFPTDLKYTKNDEWIRVEGGIGTVGITDYAQDHLSDLVYLDYAVKPGQQVAQGLRRTVEGRGAEDRTAQETERWRGL